MGPCPHMHDGTNLPVGTSRRFGAALGVSVACLFTLPSICIAPMRAAACWSRTSWCISVAASAVLCWLHSARPLAYVYAWCVTKS